MTKGDIERYRVESAIAAMQAMIGNDLYDSTHTACEDIGRFAVEQADALMAELGLRGE